MGRIQAYYTGDFKIDVYSTPLTTSAKRQSLNLALKSQEILRRNYALQLRKQLFGANRSRLTVCRKLRT